LSNPRVVVGRILKPHGVQGEVLVLPTGDDPARFAPGEALFLDEAGGESLTVATCRPANGAYRVAFAGVSDRGAAEAIAGRELYQKTERLPELPDGTYYHYQLVGLEVRRADGRRLGEVAKVVELPGGDLYQVRGGEQEWMIPARSEFIDGVSLERGEIRLRDREDLLEAVERQLAPPEDRGRKRRRMRRGPARVRKRVPDDPRRT
jgi:16S rRNA processing protein RimM